MLAPAREEIPEFAVIELLAHRPHRVIFKIGLYGGLILASPVVIYEILAFIVPGLTPRERRMLLPGISGRSRSWLLGMAFAYWIILPGLAGLPARPRQRRTSRT